MHTVIVTGDSMLNLLDLNHLLANKRDYALFDNICK